MCRFQAATLFVIATWGLNEAAADMEDDPLLWKVEFTEFGISHNDGDSTITWDINAWVGKDRHKLTLKSEGKRASGVTEKTEWQLLYSHAVTPYWDFQFGWRNDVKPESDRDWLVVGVEGLAPYFIDTEITLFIGENSDWGLRLETEYEWALSERSILIPDIEINFHSFNDVSTGIGSGLSDLDLGVRWHYLFTRRLAPYFGANWKKLFGETASLARNKKKRTADVGVLVGLKFWF